MADSTLVAIRKKVRRLSRSVSEQQVSTADIDEYINTFVLYDFPEHLRLFDLRTTFIFYTTPYVDQYKTTTTGATNQFYNFKNKYVTVHDPLYIAGYRAYYTQSESEFWAQWPLIQTQINIGTGDGATTVYTGTLSNNIPLTQNNVYFSSIDANNAGVVKHDVPVVDAAGVPTANGNLYVPGSEPATPPTVVDAANTVNYVTGVYTVTFGTAPASSQTVYANIAPYVASRPISCMYYDDIFTLRPIPDAVYAVQMEVYKRPTELLQTNQSPELEQWWQYISYGAALKVLQDRNDLETVALIRPEYEEQKRLVLRKTLVQESNQRAATIYSQQTGITGAPYGGTWGPGGGF